MLRWITAGESHGPALVAVLEGMVAGVGDPPRTCPPSWPGGASATGAAPRMNSRADEVELLGGVRHGLDAGRPGGDPDRQHRVAQVGDGDGGRPGRPRGARRPARNAPLTRPRPGHADLAGMQKYGFDEPGRCWSGPAPGRPRPGWRWARWPRRSCAQALGVEVVSPRGLARAGRRARRMPLPGPGDLERDRRRARCARSPRPRRGDGRRGGRGQEGRRHARRRGRGRRLRAAAGLGLLRARRPAARRPAGRRADGHPGDEGRGGRRRLRHRAPPGPPAHDEIDPGPPGVAPRYQPRRWHRRRHDQRRAAAGARGDEADLDRAAGAGHSGRRDRRGGRRASTSAPTSARCPPPGWWPRRWSRSCSPTPCWRSSAATRSPETVRNVRAYLEAARG